MVRNWSGHRGAAVVLVLCGITCLASPGTLSQTTPTASLKIVGQMTVDGKPAQTGDQFISGGAAATSKGSSGVVSIGKLGRVELQQNSTMSVTFSNSSIGGSVEAGRAEIIAEKGTSTNISVKDGSVISDGSQRTSFTIRVQAADLCVSVSVGQVEVRLGSKVARVKAGKHFSTGRPC